MHHFNVLFQRHVVFKDVTTLFTHLSIFGQKTPFRSHLAFPLKYDNIFFSTLPLLACYGHDMSYDCLNHFLLWERIRIDHIDLRFCYEAS